MQETKVKKGNKGITLVALVITVIVLLILAAVGIGAIAGEDGLIAKARQAAEDYEQAAREEANAINEIFEMANGGTGGGDEEPEQPVIDAEGNVQFTYNPSTPTRGSVTVGITTKTEYDIQYRIGDTEGEFEAYTGEITVDENTAIYVKLANNRGNTGGAATGNVQNIDKVAPNEFTMKLTATTNSITVSGSTTDVGSPGCAVSNIGISGYQFKLDNGNWTAKQGSGEYTFSGLTQGTKHTVQMKAIDLAGNERLATIGGTETGEITTEEVVDSTGVIGISYSPTTPTNQNVTVTLTDNSGVEGLTLKYQIGSTTGKWTTYSMPVAMSNNGAIYARLEDNTGQANGYATGNVQNIDKVAPIISTATASTSWGTSNSVTITATDSGSSGTALSNIGIIGYGINQSSTTEPTFTTCPATTSLNQTISGITTSGTYYVWVKDQAGNTAKREVTVNVDTTAPEATLEFYYPMVESDNLNPDSFKLTAKGIDEESGVASYKVYIDGSLYTTETTTEETCIINVTGLEEETSYSCYVVVTNGAGQTKQSETIEIKTIASTATIEKIKNYPLGYYGKEVTYAPANGATENWKIFYADSENIYLIADDYVPNTYAPNAANGTAIDKTSTYRINFKTIVDNSAYTGTADIRTEDARVTKWISHINSYTSDYENMKAVAYLLDTSIWSGYKDSNNKAEYVIGGPTLELFIASYNDTHETDINYEATNQTGYNVKWSTDASYSYRINGLDTSESLYINDSTYTNAYGYWLASPSADSNYSVFRVRCGGTVNYRYYNTSDLGFRPLICLKSGIQLVEQENGKYVID